MDTNNSAIQKKTQEATDDHHALVCSATNSSSGDEGEVRHRALSVFASNRRGAGVALPTACTADLFHCNYSIIYDYTYFNMPTSYQWWLFEREAHINWSMMVTCRGSTRLDLP